jgi:Zn finger protein HypA/HybF involved in hydrogenase expression
MDKLPDNYVVCTECATMSHKDLLDDGGCPVCGSHHVVPSRSRKASWILDEEQRAERGERT